MFNPFKLPSTNSSYKEDEVTNDAETGLLFNLFKRNKRFSETDMDEAAQFGHDEMRRMRKELSNASEDDRYEIMKAALLRIEEKLGD